MNLQLLHHVSHLRCRPLPEITEMEITTHRVNIEAYNKNQTPLILGQSSTFTNVSHLRWQPLPEITEMEITTHRINTDLQQKPNITIFQSIFNYCIMLAILDVSHYQKSQKWQLQLIESNIETCNKNQIPLSLGQSSTFTKCRQS